MICIGIGGSYLGSEFLVESLKTEPTAAKNAEGRNIRYVRPFFCSSLHARMHSAKGNVYVYNVNRCMRIL